MNTLEEMNEVLAGFAVHTGFPQKRSTLAGKLLSDGVTTEQVEAVGQNCEAMVEGQANAIRVLISLLEDHEKLKARIEDLAVIAAAQAKRKEKAQPRPFGDKRAEPGPMAEETPEQWEFTRRCVMAYCRVQQDRHDPLRVAADLGVSMENLQQMIAKGREIQCAPKVVKRTTAEEVEDHAARVQRFREMMRQKQPG
jgi:hypothetical protein